MQRSVAKPERAHSRLLILLTMIYDATRTLLNQDYDGKSSGDLKLP